MKIKTKRAVIVYPLMNGKVLMAKKQQVLGIGKWFGYGGKIEQGETALAAACREFEEESGGMIVKEKDLFPVALIDFYKGNEQSYGSPNFKVLFYVVKIFTGEPKDTDEMKEATWFSVDQLPLEEMKAGDELIIPHVLAENPHLGYLRFSENEKEVLDYFIEPCKISSLVID